MAVDLNLHKHTVCHAFCLAMQQNDTPNGFGGLTFNFYQKVIPTGLVDSRIIEHFNPRAPHSALASRECGGLLALQPEADC